MSNTQMSAIASVLYPTIPLFSMVSFTSADAISVSPDHRCGNGTERSSNHSASPV